VGNFTGFLEGLHGPVIYVVVAALVFGEAALFFGFVLPGETAIVIGGLLASEGRVELPILLVIVVLSAIVGDSVGYEIGRRFGPRLIQHKRVQKHGSKIEGAQGLIRRRGPIAVFIGRWTALLRAVMPALAGSAKMPYPRFLIFNALGGICWGITYTLGGYYAGKAFERTASAIGRWGAIVIGVIVVIAIAVWAIRRHRQETAPDEDSEEESALRQ
jgi:membrane-associated protein